MVLAGLCQRKLCQLQFGTTAQSNKCAETKKTFSSGKKIHWVSYKVDK